MNNQKGAANVVLTIIIVILLIVVSYLLLNKKSVTTPVTVTPSPVTSEWKTYSDSSIEFQYPSILTTQKVGDEVNVNHSIPYKHGNACDFKGDAPPLEKLTDFNISMKVYNKNIKELVQSGTFPDWDYVSKNPYKMGNWSGYKVQQGVEGCGSDLYYLIISPNKTLVINRSLITELSPAVGDYQKNLSLPGIIKPDQTEEYFNRVLSSIKIKTSDISSTINNKFSAQPLSGQAPLVV